MVKVKLLQLETFYCQIHFLDGDFVVLGIEGWSSPLRRPRLIKFPDQCRFASLVQKRDGSRQSPCFSLHPLLAPQKQLVIVRESALESDVCKLALARNLAHRDVFITFAVFHDVGFRTQPSDLRKSGSHPLDVDDEIERSEGIISARISCHKILLTLVQPPWSSARCGRSQTLRA